MKVWTASERGGAEEIEVVGDEHEATDMERRVDCTRCVREYEPLNTKLLGEKTDSCSDFTSRQTFIQMATSLGDNDFLA